LRDWLFCHQRWIAFQGELVKGEERLEKYYIAKISVKEYSGANNV
jgi:hypothetical protein